MVGENRGVGDWQESRVSIAGCCSDPGAGQTTDRGRDEDESVGEATAVRAEHEQQHVMGWVVKFFFLFLARF